MKSNYNISKQLIILFALGICVDIAYSSEQFDCFTRDGIVNDIVLSEPYIWCATGGGVVRWDKRDGLWTRYTCVDGLPIGAFWENISCDGDGCIWVYAYSPTKVMIFDGVVWRTPDNKDWHSKVRCPMIEDGKGGTWAYYEGGGVVHFDGDSYKIYNPANALSGSVVTALAIDQNNGIYVGTSIGLSHFDGVNWIIYSGESAPPGTDVRSIAIDLGNTVWVVTNKGIFHQQEESWVPFILDNNFQQMIVGPDGVKWYATSAGGLKRHDGVSWQSFEKSNSSIPENYIKKVVIDDEGVIWLTCNRSIANFAGYGLTRFDGNVWLNWNTDGPIYNIVYSAAVDHDNVKWFGSDIGVSCHDGKKWSSYCQVEDRNITGVHLIVVDKNNRKWFIGPSVVSFNGSEWMFHNSENTASQMLDMAAYAVAENGTEWVGTNSTGLWRRNNSVWEKINIFNINQYYGISSLAIDKGNLVWVGTDGGIVSTDGETHLHHDDGPDSLITSIAVNSMNIKWIGTRYSGLWRYDGIAWTNFTKENSGLSDNYIRSVVVDQDDVIWCIVSGFNRLQSFNGSAWKTVDNFRIDSFPVEATVVDSDNVKWFSTWGAGIFSLKTKTYSNINAYPIKPSVWAICGIYPNPFNSSTLIWFSIDHKSFAEINIYNSVGQIVRSLVSKFFPAGSNSIIWDGRDNHGLRVASGIYVARVLLYDKSYNMKMIMMK